MNVRGHARILAAALAALVVPACSLLVDTNDLSGGTEAGATDAPTTVDARIDAPDDRTAVADAKGCRVAVAVADDIVSATTVTCGLDRALARDGLVAGLDRATDTQGPSVAGYEVSSCLRVDFGEERRFETVVVRAQRMPTGCTTPCTVTEGGCGTGNRAYLFARGASGSYELLDDLSVTGTLADYPVPVRVGLSIRYALVCRANSGTGREDIGVDVIEGCD